MVHQDTVGYRDLSLWIVGIDLPIYIGHTFGESVKLLVKKLAGIPLILKGDAQRVGIKVSSPLERLHTLPDQQCHLVAYRP